MAERIRIRLRDIVNNEERLAPGHRLCAGCAEPTIIRQVLHAIDYPVVVGTATGCLEVSTTVYPSTSWRVPWIHNAFENASTTISGVEAAYRVLKRTGRIPKDSEIKFLAIGGDGASYDIGLQFISGALERGHKFVYLCLNNEAYMNTASSVPAPPHEGRTPPPLRRARSSPARSSGASPSPASWPRTISPTWPRLRPTTTAT